MHTPHDIDSAGHRCRVTRTHLADGRELLYFDDTAPYVDGENRRLDDPRELPPARTVSEMRRDPLTGDWIAFAAHRMNRTFMPPAGENPLAPTKPGQLPTEIPADDYNVVVFENRFPSFSLHMAEEDKDASDVDGEPLFSRQPAVCRCEVVCFTPESEGSFRDLSPYRARTVIEAWAHRTAELSQLPEAAAVFPFENRGEEIGVTLQHPHGQIYTYPFIPPRLKAIVAQARKYREDTGGDLFADLLEAERRAGTRIIKEWEHFTLFVPAAAKWPVEVMLMPKRDVKDFSELTEAEKDELAYAYLDVLQRIDKYYEGVEKTPYISAWNQAPCTSGTAKPEFGIRGDEREYMRFHLQLYSLMRSPGRMKFLAGSESAMGAWINDTTPEFIAEKMRAIGDQITR